MTQGNPRHSRVLSALTALNIALEIAMYIGETAIAERHWLTTLITYAPQQLSALPTVLLLVFSFISRRKAMIAANAMVALFLVFTLLGFNVPFGGGATPGAVGIRVMTYNIHHASKGAELIARNVRMYRPDVVCLQEANPEGNGHDPAVELQRLLPEMHCAAHQQLVVFSRYPITECEAHPAPVDYWRVPLQITVLPGGRRVTIIDMHLNTAARAETLMDHRGTTPAYLSDAARVRAVQIDRLLRVTQRIAGPVIVAGDFNTPPRGLLYRQLTGEFVDSFAAAGWGFGYSFSSDLPAMRIDYIFAGKGLRPVRCVTPALPGSDHRPVIADLALDRQGKS